MNEHMGDGELPMDYEYDGIEELDNSPPSWWLYEQQNADR